MTALLNSVKDAFTNPDNPWYYVIGSAFLVLLIAAIVVYSIVTKKRAAKNQSKEEHVEGESVGEAAVEDKEENEDNAVKDHSDSEEQSVSDKPVDENKDGIEQEERPADVTVTGAAEAENNSAVDEIAEEKKAEQDSETESKPDARNDATPSENAVVPDAAEENDEPAEKGEQEQSVATGEEAETQAKPAAKKPAAKKPAEKKTSATKPFIDRLIADSGVHGVYNEIKNTLLAYPGIKAKLTREDEQFYFGTEKKAAVALERGCIVLYLSNDPKSIPTQFKVKPAEGDLPAKLRVTEDIADDAHKLIVFAMNVSMLTRNDKHRYTDYIQKAIDAKHRAKK